MSQEHGTRGSYIYYGCRCDVCRAAASQYRNDQRLRTGVIKSHRKLVVLLKLECQHCKVEVFRKRVRGNVFCSQLCSAKSKEEAVVLAILEAGTAAGFGVRSTKKAIRHRDGSCCVICKLKKWGEVDIPLVLDHIDGNPENWSLTNLRLICCNCDALTPTYKGKNRGNGRHARRERYAAGKSY